MSDTHVNLTEIEKELIERNRGKFRENFLISCLRQGKQLGLSENEILKRIIMAMFESDETVYRNELDKAVNRVDPLFVVTNESFKGKE